MCARPTGLLGLPWTIESSTATSTLPIRVLIGTADAKALLVQAVHNRLRSRNLKPGPKRSLSRRALLLHLRRGLHLRLQPFARPLLLGPRHTSLAGRKAISIRALPASVASPAANR